jgi:transposase-like protein
VVSAQSWLLEVRTKQATVMDEHQTTSTTHDELINLLLHDGLGEGLPKIAEMLMNAAMLMERSKHLGVGPYERGEQRNGQANGFKPRSFHTSIGGLKLATPQVRGSEIPFRTSLLEKGSRSDRSLKAAISSMYLQGVSTRRVSAVMGELCGFEVSSTQVSNLTAELDGEFEKWRNRPLPEISHLFADGTYYKVRIDGSVRDCATLLAIGIRRDNGKRLILGVSCAISEAEVHWRDFFTSLKQRGIGIPDSITSDAHEGLRAALRATLNSSPWQRCQFHLQQNAQAYVPTKDLKQKVAEDIRRIFNAEDRPHAEAKLAEFVVSYEKSAPKLATWAEHNIPEGLTVFSFPDAIHLRLRTSNMCETLNSQIKRRTRVVGLFPNEASLLRLVTGVIIEISEEWETGKIYLQPQTKTKQAN